MNRIFKLRYLIVGILSLALTSCCTSNTTTDATATASTEKNAKTSNESEEKNKEPAKKEAKETTKEKSKEETKKETKEQVKDETKEDEKEEDKEEKPFTGTFDITTNYMWRGISLTDNLPAFQGGFSYTLLKTGLYVSLWGSNVKFLDERGGIATVEVDAMGGINRSIGHFSYNIYLERYSYPKTDGINYNELIADLSFYIFNALIGYSKDVYGVGKSGTYYSIGINYDIPPKYIFNFNNMNISGGIGHYSLPRSADLRSYNDYNVKLSKTWGNYVLDLQWTSTNGRSVDEPHLKDAHIVATLTANF